MMEVGAIVGIFSSVTGMYISYYANVPSGAAIVLVVPELFILALLFSPSQGILSRPETIGKSSQILKNLSQLIRSKRNWELTFPHLLIQSVQV